MAQLGKDALDFNVEVFEAAFGGEPERVPELARGAAAASTNVVAKGASAALAHPERTAGVTLGSLVASGPLFKAARAVGPRTSASRSLRPSFWARPNFLVAHHGHGVGGGVTACRT